MDIRQLQILCLGRDGFVTALVSLLHQARFPGKKNITLLKIRSRLRYLPLLLATVVFAGCAQLSSMSSAGAETGQATVEEQSEPVASFEPDTLYDLLVAEVAGHNQRFDLALGNYLQQAHKTGDPGLAARAYQIAAYIGARQASRDAAELWASVDPDNPAALQARAIELARAGEYQTAADEMLKVLEMTGDASFEFVAVSAADQGQEERDMLIATFDQALKRYPNNSQVLLGKAILLQYNGRNAEAIKLCDRILKREDNLKAVMLKGRVLMAMERPDDARRFLADYVEDAPDNTRLRLLYARVLVHAQRLDQAQEQFEILLAQSPNDPDILLSLGLITFENTMPEEAVGYFERLSAFNSHKNLAEFYLGRLAQQQDDWQLARQHYLNVGVGKQLIPAYAALAQMLADHEMWPQAVKDLRAARELYPAFVPQFYLMEGDVLIEQRAYEQAAEVLNKAVKTYPDNINLLYARAMLAEKMSDLALLEKDLRGILDIDAENAAALNALGYTLADRTERFDEAEELVSKAYELKPDDPAIIDSMGWVAYRQQDFEKALRYLRAAYEKMPDAEVAAHLGEVLWVKGNRKEATLLWEQALERQPDSEILKETMERLQVGQ